MGMPVESTHEKQPLQKIRVYPGADAEFPLYNDDGFTYASEQGVHQLTKLHWNDGKHMLSLEGAKTWPASTEGSIEIVGR